MSANIGTSGCAIKVDHSFEDGTRNALSGDAVVAKRREKVENFGLDPRRILSEYCRECGGMMDLEHFSAMAVDG